MIGSALAGVGTAAVLAGCQRTASDPTAPLPTAAGYRTTAPKAAPGAALSVDVCVYGATSAGVMAAVQVARSGRRAALLAFGATVGGMTTSGLSATDTGATRTIGGLAREFYATMGQAYGVPTAYNFEPHIAQEAFDELAATDGIVTRRFAHLESVEVSNHKITRIFLDDGSVIAAGAFIDASYEGDLMARCGLVNWTSGREASTIYRESYAGVTPLRPAQDFRAPVDPYNAPGQPDSGVIAGVSSATPGPTQSGDKLLPAFAFRLCITDRRKNQIPIEAPAGYRSDTYELVRRYIAAGVWDAIAFRVPIGNEKYDLNSTNAVSTDDVGASAGWVDASYQQRDQIFRAHRAYQQGLLWFLATDARLPAPIRTEAARFGLASDEFAATGGWPPLLYVREARRMISSYVIGQDDCLGATAPSDPVALASYKIDCHSCARVVIAHTAANEGLLSVAVPRPFAIPYRSIVPLRAECTNLVVPVCLSASHVAFGALRLEPVFMMLGQSAGAIASMALDHRVGVQDLDPPALADALRASGQILA